jgi:paired amphipathic helix protein Sin3a
LEILQTYQRESKPIQDVYGQVTQLFTGAPDLLEDFKQFLPESAAHAKAVERERQRAEENAMMSNLRSTGDGGMYPSPITSREAQMGTPNHGRGGLPPVGNFAPTPVAKDNKKRKPERQSTADSVAGPIGAKAPFGGPQGKRQKQTHPQTKGPSDQPPPSPSLVPALPVPMPPTTTSAATSEEMNFFERSKKVIGNKNTTTEFLKLFNLYSQDFIDKGTLHFRARAFIGGNPDLVKWLQEYLGLGEEEAEGRELKPRIPTGRISLSNCRGLGPSYRLLPKRERQKSCSGRDELCNSVLNDEWASHPTWASEDSGFIAHRKNQFEEALHRIEEERHDYDYNIEACSRTIQLLQPIAQQLRRSSDQEQKQYKLPPGLGGQSETIYKRVIMKIYGRERGQSVISELHNSPYSVIPIVLNRLKERLETWKMAQREWEKVWRDQTQKMFWKSLDHQAVNATATNRKQFQTKALQTEIAVKHEEMRRQENVMPGTMRKPQIEVVVEDTDVVIDVAHLILRYIRQNLMTDHPKLESFVLEFVPLFFGLDTEHFNATIKAKLAGTPVPDPVDEPLSGAEDAGSSKARKGKTSLLRSALDPARGRKFGRKDREDSNASASRASTPDVASNAGDAEDMAVDAPEENYEAPSEKPVTRWFEHPQDGNLLGNKRVDPSEPQKRDTYRLWASPPIYCFMRMFLTFYERLLKLKRSEASAAESIKNAMKPKPAADIGILDKIPTDFFADVNPSPSSQYYYYNQMLAKFEAVLNGELEFAPDVEETLRRYYLQSGYPLYSFEKMVLATTRFALNILNSEGKEKSYDIFQLFRKDRVKDTTTIQQQSDYRKGVEKMVRDGDLYRIDYVSWTSCLPLWKRIADLTCLKDQSKQKIDFFLVKTDDPTHYDDGLSPLDMENRWRQYIASYQSIDDTENIPRDRVEFPFKLRNVKAMGADPKSTSYPPSPPAEQAGLTDGLTAANANGAEGSALNRFMVVQNEEKLEVRVTVGEYKLQFEPKSYEAFAQPFLIRTGSKSDVVEAADARERRAEEVKEKYEFRNAALMQDLTKEEVEAKNEWFSKLVSEGEDAVDGGEEGVTALAENGEAEGEGMEVDQ